ncbi:MAG: hypothetical protein OXI20_12265 [Rhodospirillales bacterium]|nr:hypothetical protein [Rhodospirillales bacterium]
MCRLDRAIVGLRRGDGFAGGLAPIAGETDIAQSTATGPNGGAHASPRPSVLPAFVTPDWLAENHHLMKADMRRLSGQLREEYPDWPADADGGDAAAFWRAVHALADRWTYFLPLFEERILATFGLVKGTKKQLGPRLFHAAGDRARVLRPLAPGEPEPRVMEDLETLFVAGEHWLVAQAVWVLSCLEGPDNRYAVSPWLEQPEIDALVGDAVGRMRPGWRPERADLVERLTDEAAGPHLEKLAARAAEECAALDAGIATAWSTLRTHVADHDSYDPAAELVSFLLFDLGMLADERDEIADARDGALARMRHAALGTLLGDAVDPLPDTAQGAAADALKDGVAALVKDDRLPAVFPDAEWETCRELAERFCVAIVEPGERELALREASRRYGEDPSAANLEALHEAAAAERASPRSLEPADAALRAIAACLGKLVGRFGTLADRVRAADEIAETMTEPPEHAMRAEIADARALVRDAEARIVELTAALEAAAKENDALRRERHRLGERLAGLEGGSAPAGNGSVPPLAAYTDLPDWMERHFPGRVVLAGRALRTLKSARFEDVALVGRAVALLGTAYHRMKTEGGMELREAFEDALRELKLQETPSISADRQGKARDGYEIDWEGKRLTLDRHLKNNSGTRDPRRCMRIYFAWDEDAARVVIGHLPGHMRI